MITSSPLPDMTRDRLPKRIPTMAKSESEKVVLAKPTEPNVAYNPAIKKVETTP